MSETFSRHTNEQYRWQTDIIRQLGELDSRARVLKHTQAAYLDEREAIFATPAAKRLTRDRMAACRGYERALSDIRWRELTFCWRIAGQPDTAVPCGWDSMPEAVREACRTHNAEGAHCWDTAGRYPWGPWTLA